MGKAAPRNGSGHGSSVDPDEIAKFSALAEAWWDPDGDFRPLHRLNPVRLNFICENIATRHRRDPRAEQPLRGLTILDVGCGGGLLCEPLTRLGARLTGIDPSASNVRIARLHAAAGHLEIDYRQSTAEDLGSSAARYDAVLAMEVVEHVADVTAFLEACAALVKPGGVMIAATLNRTAKAFILAILGAEYLLRWLPRGTHDWSKFLRPSELAGQLRAHGLVVEEITGVLYNPLTASWRLGRDLDVNYMILARKT